MRGRRTRNPSNARSSRIACRASTLARLLPARRLPRLVAACRSPALRLARRVGNQETCYVGPEGLEAPAVEVAPRYEPVDVGRIVLRVPEVAEDVEVVGHGGVDDLPPGLGERRSALTAGLRDDLPTSESAAARFVTDRRRPKQRRRQGDTRGRPNLSSVWRAFASSSTRRRRIAGQESMGLLKLAQRVRRLGEQDEPFHTEALQPGPC